jgi:hypothetical protein
VIGEGRRVISTHNTNPRAAMVKGVVRFKHRRNYYQQEDAG